MVLTLTDWIVIAIYLLLNLLISLYYRRRSSGSTEEFFVSGRNVSGWLGGTSMVATTFAADTPLLVTGLVAKNGISGNWLWWSQCLSGMMTVFFFERRQYRAKKNTVIIPERHCDHHNQLPEMPFFATKPVTSKGVSAANVVATIDVPPNHPDTLRPETKNSSVLPDERLR